MRRSCTSVVQNPLGVATLLIIAMLLAQPAAFAFRIVSIEPVGTNVLRLKWNAIPGKAYQIQHTANLFNGTNAVWMPSFTLSATGPVSVAEDVIGIGVTQVFFRVVQLADQSSLTVSPIAISLSASNGQPNSLLALTTAGTQTVSSVAFFDGGVFLGFGEAGLAGSWSFELGGDAEAALLRRISARVVTIEGTTNETDVHAFLQMNPSRLVPLDEQGAPQYGEFVAVDEMGKLGACRFYPEGVGDAARLTGAHFDFPDGGFFRPENGGGIEFASGTFSRGAQDPAPVSTGIGSHSLDFAGVNRAAVSGALGLPAQSSIELLWNGLPLTWEDGELSGKGWSGLNVRPPIGDFLLPNGQECALVSFDASSGEPTLIVCYHGEWTPFSEGPLFRIPKAEPLKIYVNWSGNIAAHGTVDALFGGGATLRGSVSWRHPYFEVRLQGRNIVIPALASLTRALPSNPASILPPGNSTAELDSATKLLASFRDTYRALAMGGVAEAKLDSNATFDPQAEPTDPSGTALGAWAARLASWAVDRTGQTMDAQMLADLHNTVLNAAKTGEQANDLPTVLKFLRDVLVLQQNRNIPLGGSAEAEALRLQMQDSEDRLFAAAERVIGETPNFEASPQFAELVNLFQSATSIPPAGADAKAAKNATRLNDLMARTKGKIGPQFAGRVVQASLNQGLGTLSTRDLLKFLSEVVVYRELLLASGGGAAPGAPTLQQVAQAALNVRTHFATKSDANAGTARSPADYFKLRDVVQERVQFFTSNDRLGLTMASADGGFFFQTAGLLQALAETFGNLPLADKARACRDMEFVAALIQHTSDNGAGAGVSEADALIQNCNTLTADALASSSQDSRCDDLARALLKEGFTIARREPAQEGASFDDITGLYESAEDGTESYVTVQLNQGGRYLRGGMQLQVQSAEGRSARYLMWNLEGMFLRQTANPAVKEFACRLVNVVDGSVKFVRGTSQPNGVGGFFLQLGNVLFEQRSPNGRYSDAILSAFDDGQRRSITASQQTPMHTRITARTTADAADLRFTLDQYFSDAAGQAQEQAAADALVQKLQRIDQRLTVAQRPVAAALLRRVLSTMQPKSVKKSKITGNPTDLGNQTLLYWDLLLVVSIRQNLNLAEQLGMTASQFQQLQNALGANNFRYDLTVQQNSFTAGEAFLTFGAGELTVTVKKFSSGGSLLETFFLEGFIGSWSPGVGIPVPISCAITTNTYTFSSPLNFQASDFAGPVDFAQFGVNGAVPNNTVLSVQLDLIKAAAGIDPSINSWQIGYFSVYGSGNFPAMTFKTTPVTGFQVNGCQLNVGVGVDIGGGHLTASDPPDGQSLLFNPGQTVSFDVSANPALDGGVFFEINGSTLTECGWQFLRTFVAEHHELLVGTKSKIRVEGHTDAAGGGTFNQTLSEARANSVKSALMGLLGNRLKTTVIATGFGETQHDQVLGIGPNDPAPNDALFRRADIIVGGVVKATLGAPITPQQ